MIDTIKEEMIADTLQDSICLVNRVCKSCGRCGCWIRDEENNNIAICKCGEEIIVDEEIEARSLDK